MRKGRNDSILHPRVWTSINQSQGTSSHLFHAWLYLSDGGYISLACSERSFKPFPRKIVINSHLVPRSSRKSFFYGHHKPPKPSDNELRISLPQCRESLRSKAVSVKGSGDLSFYFMEMMKLCKLSPGSTYFFKYGTYCMCVPVCQQRSQHHTRQGCEWLCLE